MWSIHNAVVRATSEPKTDYGKLKRKINRTTLGYGSALTTMYFITQGAEQGVSSSLGVISSFVYLSLLERHVDNIENSPFQKQLMAPIGTAVFETIWNSAPFAFDFDYGATFVGFLTYKLALLSVIYDEVRKMLLSEEEG
tara:strand:+ start:6086 stop:6505 length:420 start_codon:yes stop_codon:yes gene_type:complete